MDSSIPELDSISRRLVGLDRPQKPKMLVVDDEPDNLDLLYRTFRRDFSVLRAESGVAALEILAAEGEVAVIISDQRMPEMKGTEFLSKTVPQFPNTMRIILTGFTDVEDLVEAINSGQVYKYITKPWDPNELKSVVQRATETYELLKHRTEELHRAQMQTLLINTILQSSRQPSLDACLQTLAAAFGNTFSTDGCIVQLVENGELAGAQGRHNTAPELENWLSEEPLTAEAIAHKEMQVAMNVPSDPALSQNQHYLNAGIQAHVLIPVVFQEQVVALLSLQWKEPCKLREDELNLLHLAVQQVALVLTCVRHVPVVV